MSALVTYLVRVEFRTMCFGFEVVDGVVGERCAPIAKWMIGRNGRDVVRYWTKRGAEVSWQRVDAVVSGQEAQSGSVPARVGRRDQARNRHLGSLQSRG